MASNDLPSSTPTSQPVPNPELPEATQASGTLSGQPPTLPSWLQPTNPQPVVTQQGDTTLPTSQPATQRQTANPTDAAQPGDTPPPAMQPLQLHPFSNPSLPPIPARLLKSIQARLYIDLSELLSEALADAFDRPPPPPLKRGRRTREAGNGSSSRTPWTGASLLQPLRQPARITTPRWPLSS